MCEQCPGPRALEPINSLGLCYTTLESYNFQKENLIDYLTELTCSCHLNKCKYRH